MKTDFFNVLSVSEFIAALQSFPPLPSEEVPLLDASGRILAQNIISPEDLPLAPRSCMDGYAVKAQDVFGASEMNPAYLECIGNIDIEHPATFSLTHGQCATIVTGGILPEGADAVMMVEHTEELGAGTVEMRKSLAPNEHVMLQGEDATKGSPVLAKGTRLRPQEIGILAALGITQIPVFKIPTVGIISTGDELISVEGTPRIGQVRDVNSYTLSCLVHAMGGTAKQYGLVPDDLASLTESLEVALAENDVVFLSGGSSVGTRDHTVAAIDAINGAELVNHGVAISPGKPLILAKTQREGCSKAIWGLPGQVASAQVVMFILGIPFLKHLSGDGTAFDISRRPAKRGILGRNVASKQGREDYVRVRLTDADEETGLPVIQPVLGKSGLLKTMIRADGVIRIPADSEGVYKDAELDVLLF